MEVDAAPAPLASERVLGSVDLVSQILYFHARELNGRRHTLARARAVCSTWRDAFAATQLQIAGWHTLSWTFAGVSRAKPDESFISTPDSNPSPYAWQIDLHPRLVRYKPISMEDFHENPPDPATLAWDDGRGLLVRTEVVGAYLRVLPPARAAEEDTVTAAVRGAQARAEHALAAAEAAAQSAEGAGAAAAAAALADVKRLGVEAKALAELAENIHKDLESAKVRRTEAVITLVHPTDARQSRSRYFRHMFDQDSQDWGYPDSSANGFGTTEELKALGFLGAAGDVLRLDARVRVTPGQHSCGKSDVGHPTGRVYHPLSRAEPYLRQWCADVPESYKSFYCDICGSSTSTTDTARLFRCAAGCNYDVCDACIDGVTVKQGRGHAHAALW